MGDISISNCPTCGFRAHCCKCQKHHCDKIPEDLEPPKLVRSRARTRIETYPEPVAEPNPTPEEHEFMEGERITRMLELQHRMDELNQEAEVHSHTAAALAKIQEHIANINPIFMPRDDNVLSPSDIVPMPDLPSPRAQTPPPVAEMTLSNPPKAPSKTKKLKKKKTSEAFLRLTQSTKTLKPKPKKADSTTR